MSSTEREVTVPAFQLSAEAAAGLIRFAEKISYSDAMGTLYGHVPKEVREQQASEIIAGFSALERALSDAGVTSWPWIETGRPR